MSALIPLFAMTDMAFCIGALFACGILTHHLLFLMVSQPMAIPVRVKRRRPF